MKHCPKCQRNWNVDGNQKCPYCDCALMAGSSPAIGSAPPRPIANEIADYKATPQAAKDLLNKLFSALIDLRCPHCGEAGNVTIET